MVGSDPAALVRGGGVIAYPTDTVWGLGGDARRPDVVARVRALKGRDGRPMLVLVDDLARIREWIAELPAPLERVLAARLPATVLLPASPRAPSALVGHEGEIGVRCPAGWVGEFCTRIEAPLLSTSANRSGEPTATTRAGLSRDIRRGVDGVAEGEVPPGGAPSTLVRFGGGVIVVLRPGAATAERLAEMAGVEVRPLAVG